MILADRYRSDTASWRSGLDPMSAITAITQQFSNWRWYREEMGTTARIVPRSRGVPVYVFEISATPAYGGSEITTSVIPSTPVVARYLIAFSTIAIIGAVLTALKVAVQVFIFDPAALLLIGCLGTLVTGAQFLGMGVARRGGSNRLASAMAAAGVVPAASQPPPLDAPPNPPLTAP